MLEFSHATMDMSMKRSIGLSDTSNITCAAPIPNEHGDPIFGNVTLRQLMIYISGPSLIITVLSSVFLSFKHLHRYTNPQEQRQMLRIINLPVFYCLFNFLAILFILDYQYIEPIAGVYESVVVSSLFMLLLEWTCPDGMDREAFFQKLPLKDKKGNIEPGGSLKWFQQTWQQAFQFPLVTLVTTVIEIITQYYHVYCESSFSPKYAHLWLFLADTLVLGGGLGAVIKYAQRFKGEIDPSHRSKPKIYSLLGILVFQFLQGLVFHLLNGKLFSPSKTATYNDINFGIPSLLTCIESVIFSLLFQWSYSSREFKQGEKLDRYGLAPAQRRSTFRALLDALNISDLLNGIIVAVQLLFTNVASRYGGAKPPQRQRTFEMENQSHLEPSRGAGPGNGKYGRGYSGGGASAGEDAPLQTPDYAAGYAAPPYMPPPRDTSPPQDDYYGEPSPHNMPPQHPRPMF